MHSKKNNNCTRLAIMANILTPYRLPVYNVLAEKFDTLVLIGAPEDNRRWQISTTESGFETKIVWGTAIKRRIRGVNGSTSDLRYTHFNPGYFFGLLRFRPHAIISTEMGLRSLLAMLYGFTFRVPVWIWWGGTPHTERNRSRGKRLLRQLIFARLVRHWISYGSSSTEYLQSLEIPGKRILQIQNCVDDRLFQRHIEPHSFDMTRPIGLIVGQLIGRKGIYQLIEAAATLQREGTSISLLFVGDGPEASRLKAEVNRLGLRHVHMIDYVPPEQMPSIYKSADFLVFPTLEDVWGLVVNEALLTGTPVIASQYAGCARELLPDTNVFDPFDQASFVATLRRAAQGQLEPADIANLQSVNEVAGAIIEDVKRQLSIHSSEIQNDYRLDQVG